MAVVKQKLQSLEDELAQKPRPANVSSTIGTPIPPTPKPVGPKVQPLAGSQGVYTSQPFRPSPQYQPYHYSTPISPPRPKKNRTLLSRSLRVVGGVTIILAFFIWLSDTHYFTVLGSCLVIPVLSSLCILLSALFPKTQRASALNIAGTVIGLLGVGILFLMIGGLIYNVTGESQAPPGGIQELDTIRVAFWMGAIGGCIAVLGTLLP